MGLAKISIHDDELRISTPNGSEKIPTAAEIFAFTFQDQDMIGDLIVSRNIPNSLSFSKFPLSLSLHIKAEKHYDGVAIYAEIVAAGEGVSVKVPNALERTSDHIVVHGTWYPFVNGSIDEIRSIMIKSGVSNLENLTLRQYLDLTRISISSPLIHDETEHLLDANAVDVETSALRLSGFLGTLYPYQAMGYRWLARLTGEGLGCVLADQMGLGKTIQIIALLVSQCRKQNGGTLIIAPATILENWRRELKRFAPQLTVAVHQGGSRTGFPRHLQEFDVVIASYDTVVRDAALLRMIDWYLIIADEAQAIKNPEAKRTTVLKSIPRLAAIAITGTPVENKLEDLWSIVDFVLPGLLGDRHYFNASFGNEPSDAERLEPLVSPILLRRQLSDVANDLPPRIDIPQPLELNPSEAEKYEKLRSTVESEQGDAATLVTLGKLRQFCAHPFQITGEWGDPLAVSAKYARLTEILEEIFINAEKVLLFLHYHHITDVFVKDLAKRFDVYADWVDGRVEGTSRQWKIDQFSNQSGAAVLILNPRSAGTGLNLTAANHVIHYSPDWNPAVEDQASARAHRRGQVKPVTVHCLYFVDTVEEVIMERLDRKRDLAGKAVVGTAGKDEDRRDILKALKASPLRRSVG